MSVWNHKTTQLFSTVQLMSLYIWFEFDLQYSCLSGIFIASLQVWCLKSQSPNIFWSKSWKCTIYRTLWGFSPWKPAFPLPPSCRPKMWNSWWDICHRCEKYFLSDSSAAFQYHQLLKVMPTLRQCAEDKSWRVRYMVADKFTELQVSGLWIFGQTYDSSMSINWLACTGCCGKRDHKDWPGASLPITPQRLRSRGNLKH